MSSPAQAIANRANSQLSSGPKSEAGKAASCRNNFRYGLAGAFVVLESEDQAGFSALLESLREEHQAATPTEQLLVHKMAQHYWLSQRAQRLQSLLFQDQDNDLAAGQEKQFALFLRYQTTNDRGFHKCLSDLLKLRGEKRKAEIGFESQKRQEAEEVRRQATENRKQDRHEWALVMDSAKLDHQCLQNLKFEGGAKLVDKTVQRIIALKKTAA